MQCPLCGRTYVFELDFSNLFSKDKPCPSCQKILDQQYLEETIPVSRGVISYRYFTDQSSLAYEVYQIYAYQFAKALDMAISHDLIIVIESHEYSTIEAWLPLFFGFGSILIISVIWFDIARYTG